MLSGRLAAANREAGHPDRAERELDAACRMFEALGAGRWAALVRSERSERASIPPPSGPPTEPEACVFRCAGDTRTLRFAGVEAHVKDLTGMRYLERLLREPGRDFHALDLVSVERGALPTAHARHELDGEALGQQGLVVFDATAREAYRRRLAEVDADIAEAETNNDLERARLARADRDYLVTELARGVGLGGRSRKIGEGAERARIAATRALRYALRRITEHHPLLGEHLQRSVRTGTYFCYDPDPLSGVRWTS